MLITTPLRTWIGTWQASSGMLCLSCNILSNTTKKTHIPTIFFLSKFILRPNCTPFCLLQCSQKIFCSANPSVTLCDGLFFFLLSDFHAVSTTLWEAVHVAFLIYQTTYSSTTKEALTHGNTSTLCKMKFLYNRGPVLFTIQYLLLDKYQMKDVDIIFLMIPLSVLWAHMSSACFIVQPFYKRGAQKGQSKLHCVCIKEKQNNSSQSFLRNPSTLKLPLAHVCSACN